MLQNNAHFIILSHSKVHVHMLCVCATSVCKPSDKFTSSSYESKHSDESKRIFLFPET